MTHLSAVKAVSILHASLPLHRFLRAGGGAGVGLEGAALQDDSKSNTRVLLGIALSLSTPLPLPLEKSYQSL